jgi:voltage-gated potassium channel
MLLRLDVKLDEVSVLPQSPLDGRTIGDVEVRGNGTFIVVALLQKDGNTIIHPPQSTQLYPGDTLIVMGHSDDMPTFVFGREYSRNHNRNQRYRGLPR